MLDVFHIFLPDWLVLQTIADQRTQIHEFIIVFFVEGRLPRQAELTEIEKFRIATHQRFQMINFFDSHQNSETGIVEQQLQTFCML